MEQKRGIDRFYYGTEYYRYPTPLPENWEEDFRKMRDLGFSIIKTESAWASMEPADGVYAWEENDRLVETCDRFGMVYIPNLQWEAAPAWLFREHEVHRVSPWGLRLPPVPYSNAYVGLLLPCFDNPVTREYCGRFMERFVERYRDCGNIVAWDVWVEPRSRPGEECACEHSLRSYRGWLARRFGTVEQFSARYHKRIGCWEDVAAPAASPEYAWMYLWKQWACWSVADRVQWAADVHRRADPTRKVMAHIGACTLIQDPVNDASDDFLNARTVDFYGTSFPTAHLSRLQGEEYEREVIMGPIISDWIRCHSSYYWNMELYPGVPYTQRRKTAEDVRYDLWTAIAHGAKGIEFWQFSPELFGYESASYGLTDRDGSLNEKCGEARRVGDFVKRHGPLLHGAVIPQARAAIFFDKRSHLIRYLECSADPEIGRPDFHRSKIDPYREACYGAYHLFYGNNIPVDFLTPHTIGEIARYALVYLPMSVVMDEEIARALIEYVAGGGVVIAETNCGMRGDNTLCQRVIPGSGLSELFGVTEYEQLCKEDEPCRTLLALDGTFIRPEMFLSKLKLEGATAVVQDPAGAPRLTCNSYGKGRAYYVGTHLSLAGYRQRENAVAFFANIVEREGLRPPYTVDSEGFVTVRSMESGKRTLLFLFNHDRTARRVKLSGGGARTVVNLETGATTDLSSSDLAVGPSDVLALEVRR